MGIPGATGRITSDPSASRMQLWRSGGIPINIAPEVNVYQKHAHHFIADKAKKREFERLDFDPIESEYIHRYVSFFGFINGFYFGMAWVMRKMSDNDTDICFANLCFFLKANSKTERRLNILCFMDGFIKNTAIFVFTKFSQKKMLFSSIEIVVR